MIFAMLTRAIKTGLKWTSWYEGNHPQPTDHQRHKI